MRPANGNNSGIPLADARCALLAARCALRAAHCGTHVPSSGGGWREVLAEHDGIGESIRADAAWGRAVHRLRWWLVVLSLLRTALGMQQSPPNAVIISLSLFVDRHSSAVIRNGATIDVLIDINRTIMQGLSPVAPVQQAAQA